MAAEGRHDHNFPISLVKYAPVISARRDDLSISQSLSCLGRKNDQGANKMVRIRLRRIGLRGQPTYRVVAADKESPRDGRFLEILGVYNPRTDPATIHLKEDRVYHWMKNGALPTESVAQIFKSSGTQARFERFKKGETVDVLVKEAEEAEAKRAAPVKTRKD
jgi:small subunit ribosomal protein S16